MNKKAIREFTVWARVALVEAVKQKAYQYEIDKNADASKEVIRGIALSTNEKKQRKELIEQIKVNGFEQVMEETAYTWFNRFIALRFMEVNGYLPAKVRIFTNENGEFKPEILKEAMTVELKGIDREKIFELLDKQDNETLYKMLIIAQCNELNEKLPYMFERLENCIELLFPSNLLKADSIIGKMVSEIPEEDWINQVQIIGWLHQYYNSKLKDEIFASSKKNVKIMKEHIPASTQLFTPDWIVRYMVENSLGRLWLEGHPNNNLKLEWKYYIDEAEQEENVKIQLEQIRSKYKNINPQDIKIIDPCMGSGNILVYAFEVLMQIYTSVGCTKREAVKSILENNLYGLDIDERARSLAYFSVMMTARKYDRQIFDKDIKTNIYTINETDNTNDEAVNYFCNNDTEIIKAVNNILKEFEDAKQYGSLLTVSPQCWKKIYSRYEETKEDTHFHHKYIEEKIMPLVNIAKVLSQKYDVVVTNPPYMGNKVMNPELNKYINSYYPDSKSNLFACFIEKCIGLLNEKRFLAMITQHSWMFLTSFEKLRNKILNNNIINMVHLGAKAFEDIEGKVVQTTSFVIKNTYIKNFKSTYCRLTDPKTQQGKENMFLLNENRYISTQDNFKKIPGSPVAYWVGDKFIRAFEVGTVLKRNGDTRQGMATSDNNRFLRIWYEINFLKIGFNKQNANEALYSNKKWFPYNKGGKFRKWYGNISYTVNYENDGKEVKDYAKHLYKTPTRTIKSISEYFKPCLSWSKVSSGDISFRYYPDGFIFDVAGCCIFYKNKDRMFYDFGFINSKIAKEILIAISPTLNYEVGHIASFPVVFDSEYSTKIKLLVEENIDLSRQDWDSFETSWDFKRHPLV